MSHSRNILNRCRIAQAFAAATLLSSSAFAEDPPDLVPVALVGPQAAHVGTEFAVHFSTADLSQTFNGTYTADIVLSTDNVIDALDSVVASLTTSFLGQHAIVASIPMSQPAGEYHWGLRIHDADGEVKVSNNALLGLKVNVIKVDLVIADPSPVTVFVRLTDDEAATPEIVVTNGGTEETILVYQATPLVAAPWLSFDPPENFAVAGEEPTPTQLLINHAGLPIGSYQTTVRFHNLNNSDDFEDIVVNLIVGDAQFETGDRIQGQISVPGEEDEIVFDGLEGMKAKFRVKTTSGDIKPVLTLIDPDGFEETVLKFKHSDSYQSKNAKLKKSGEYRLVISGKNDGVGNYMIRTGRKLPKKAKAYSKTLAAGESMKVLLLSGAQVDIAAITNSAFSGPLSISMMTPVGIEFDFANALNSEPSGDLTAKGLICDDVGEYRVEASGFGGGSDEEVTIHVAPVQPKVGKSKIYLG